MSERITLNSWTMTQFDNQRNALTSSLGFEVSPSDFVAYLLKRASEVPSEVPVVETFGSDQRARLDAEVARLMQDGEKIPAIKLVRIALNLGLKEAKEYAERFPYTPPRPLSVLR